MSINKKRKKVALGLSGGVDSAVACHLLLQEDLDVTCFFMTCYDPDDSRCSAKEDRRAAVGVAAHLTVPFKNLDFIKEYEQKVLNYLYREYEAGRTPNPDIICNKEIKFGMFSSYAFANGYDFVATGHYVQNDGKFLYKAKDESKDQSYFLYQADKSILPNLLFPLGMYRKEEVRQIAKDIGLPNYDREDSAGICFIGNINFSDFLIERLGVSKGSVLDMNSQVIGSHSGAYLYTVGQRHGFKTSAYHNMPLYVVKKDINNNTITVGTKEESMLDSFYIRDLKYFDTTIFTVTENKELGVRIRHLGEIYSCEFKLDRQSLFVKTNKKVFGLAEGQSAVFYDRTSGRVVGGGIIEY